MSEAVLPPTRTLDREKAFSFLRENGVYVDGVCPPGVRRSRRTDARWVVRR